ADEHGKLETRTANEVATQRGLVHERETLNKLTTTPLAHPPAVAGQAAGLSGLKVGELRAASTTAPVKDAMSAQGGPAPMIDDRAPNQEPSGFVTSIVKELPTLSQVDAVPYVVLPALAAGLLKLKDLAAVFQDVSIRPGHGPLELSVHPFTSVTP